jgi:nicotinate-nucleotide pyrophosphorylase (carboxylating)
MFNLDKKRIDVIIRFALKEDIWTRDVTTQSVLDRFLDVDAVILARQEGVVCGIEIIERVFASVEYSLKFRPMVKDGDTIRAGQEIAFVEGEAHAILKAERTALNFLSLLSGIATRTRHLVNITEGTKARIYDTRKTIPLHRYLQKYAVTVGGGYNHRKGLWDMVLIKDNHIRSFMLQTGKKDSTQVIKELIRRAKSSVQKNIRIEIEVENLKECECALDETPDVIMLDNMPAQEVHKAVKMREEKKLANKVLFEVSGGISAENVKAYAATGVDIISSGALTSVIKPVDFSLEIIMK